MLYLNVKDRKKNGKVKTKNRHYANWHEITNKPNLCVTNFQCVSAHAEWMQSKWHTMYLLNIINKLNAIDVNAHSSRQTKTENHSEAQSNETTSTRWEWEKVSPEWANVSNRPSSQKEKTPTQEQKPQFTAICCVQNARYFYDQNGIESNELGYWKFGGLFVWVNMRVFGA